MIDKKDFHKIVSALYGVTKNVGGKESYLFADTFVEQYYVAYDEALGRLYRNDSEQTNNRLLLGGCVVPIPKDDELFSCFNDIVFYRDNAFMTNDTYSIIERISESNKSKEDYAGKVVIEVEVVYIHHYYLAFWYVGDNGELCKCRKEILVGDMKEALILARERVLTGLSSDGFKIP